MTKRLRKVTAAAIAVTAVGALIAAGATSAMWHSDLTTTAAIRDAGVMFSVNGTVATSADPGIGIELGPTQAQSLVDDGALAIAVEVQALAQGNRGLRYRVSLPELTGDGLFVSSPPAVFPVTSAAACTVDTAVPENPIQESTPVAAEYSDSTTPTTEYWCVRADLGESPISGSYSSRGTITGRHGLGTVEKHQDWTFALRTGPDPADEPIRFIRFAYETVGVRS